MKAWLRPLADALSRGEAAALVHLVELKGSAPREAGAQMLVTDDAVVGTIGGGELERAAILKARELLHVGRAGIDRFALGPALNQCCGGSVTVAYEPFAPADLAWVKKLVRAAEEPEPVIRTLRIDERGNLSRDWYVGDNSTSDFVATLTSPSRGGPTLPNAARTEESGRVAGTHPPLPKADSLRSSAFDLPSRGRLGGESRGKNSIGRLPALEIQELINPIPPPLWLFGAGHVGRAVAPALAPLGFAITWIDGRSGQFPEPPLAGVKQLALAMPELAVDEAPPGTTFLVMTHSHPLDEAICEAILRRGDFAYLGLIGSASKRARFIRRLGEAGIDGAELERLVCPIGLASIESKEPAAIAASVAADLLVRREQDALKTKESLRGG